MNENIPNTNAFLEQYPEYKKSLQVILPQIEQLPIEDRPIVLQALRRYMVEGARNSYKTECIALIGLLLDENIIKDSDDYFWDLGAGSGDLLRTLAQLYPTIKMRGIDLSPSFADNFDTPKEFPNAQMSVGLIDRPLSIGDIQENTAASVTSILTLDRLTNPLGLIRNMKKFNDGPRVLGTLLPVVPEDDNPSLQGKKIVYTRPENRIVPGLTRRGDRDALWKLLQKEWKKPVEFGEIPYIVTSSGDRQVYDLGVFYTS